VVLEIITKYDNDHGTQVAADGELELQAAVNHAT
jgi:hypothetical protein